MADLRLRHKAAAARIPKGAGTPQQKSTRGGQAKRPLMDASYPGMVYSTPRSWNRSGKTTPNGRREASVTRQNHFHTIRSCPPRGVSLLPPAGLGDDDAERGTEALRPLA